MPPIRSCVRSTEGTLAINPRSRTAVTVGLGLTLNPATALYPVAGPSTGRFVPASDTTSGGLICGICGQHFHTSELYLDHVHKHTDEERKRLRLTFVCTWDDCGLTFEDDRECNKHFNAFHKAQKMSYCGIYQPDSTRPNVMQKCLWHSTQASSVTRHRHREHSDHWTRRSRGVAVTLKRGKHQHQAEKKSYNRNKGQASAKMQYPSGISLPTASYYGNNENPATTPNIPQQVDHGSCHLTTLSSPGSTLVDDLPSVYDPAMFSPGAKQFLQDLQLDQLFDNKAASPQGSGPPHDSTSQYQLNGPKPNHSYGPVLYTGHDHPTPSGRLCAYGNPSSGHSPLPPLGATTTIASQSRLPHISAVPHTIPFTGNLARSIHPALALAPRNAPGQPTSFFVPIYHAPGYFRPMTFPYSQC